MPTLIAIDPGFSGAIAVQDEEKRVRIDKMPETVMDIWDYVANLPKDSRVLLEDVGYHRFGNNATSSCTFARHCGHWEMALVAARLSTVKVRPAKWQKTVFGKLPKDVQERKHEIRARVQPMYPTIFISLDAADSVGILRYLIMTGGVG